MIYLVGVLFKVLFGLASLNMVINLILYSIKREDLYRLLAFYWPAVLLNFVVQSQLQQDHLSIILGYSFALVPLTLFTLVGFKVTGSRYPIKKYLIFYALTFPVTLALHKLGYGFTVTAMPFAIATAAPLMHAFYKIAIEHKNTTTKMQKVLSVMYVLQAIHCINFALFRVDPTTQIWGWLVSYAIYDTLAILLPSIALEKASLFEQQRLQSLVDEKTAELNRSVRKNEHLLQILLHDVSNPLMVAKFYSDKNNDISLEKVRKSHEAMENIIKRVKALYTIDKKTDRTTLSPVEIEECFKDVSFIFADSSEKKNISLVFDNRVAPGTKVLADKTTLTHSVLSNLISNGLKFSHPNSQIKITARENFGGVVLEVQDRGPGISQDIIDGLYRNETAKSTEGTIGEQGSGFGLSIAKAFVDSYGGHMEFDPKYLHTHPHEHGTKIRITLDRA
jgi:signal transduction histidine kinase